jgi:hypothetical protein
MVSICERLEDLSSELQNISEFAFGRTKSLWKEKKANKKNQGNLGMLMMYAGDNRALGPRKPLRIGKRKLKFLSYDGLIRALLNGTGFQYEIRSENWAEFASSSTFSPRIKCVTSRRHEW